MKKIGGVFAFKVKDGPNGQEATWFVDVKNGNGCVHNDTGENISCLESGTGGFCCLRLAAVTSSDMSLCKYSTMDGNAVWSSRPAHTVVVM